MTSSRYATAKKISARQDTIVDFYRSVFGRHALPPTKQYWTMCATCVDENGRPLYGSELHQAITAGLIQPEQFHGVDRDEEVYRVNSRCIDANWYLGDFYSVLSEATGLPDFNPGIVNVDTLSEPKRGVEFFCRILERLVDVSDVLFVGNFILKNRSRVYEMSEIVKYLCANARFREVGHTLRVSTGKTFYRYGGATSNNHTEMGTVLLWRV